MKWLIVFALCILGGSCTPSKKSAGIKEKARIDFDLPDGPYTNEQLITDFGAGRYAQERNHASIVDKVYRIGFVKGEKSTTNWSCSADTCKAPQTIFPAVSDSISFGF